MAKTTKGNQLKGNEKVQGEGEGEGEGWCTSKSNFKSHRPWPIILIQLLEFMSQLSSAEQEIQDSVWGGGKSVSKLNLHNFKSSTAASKWHIDSRRGTNGNDVFDFDYANLSVGTMFAHRS